jgi:hypothetical protein
MGNCVSRRSAPLPFEIQISKIQNLERRFFIMAIYHFNMHSNKVGSSAVAHSAYISGSQLYNDRTGTTHDYSKKEDIVYTGLLLPEWVVPMSRGELWNIVESKIKDVGRNYGKTGDFAIPVEWLDTMSDEEIIGIVSKFLIENFVSKGHAVDFAFHKKDGNPHIDYFVPQLKFDESGELVPPKIKSVFANTYDKETDTYDYDPELPSYDRKDPENTNQYRFPVIDKKTGEQKIRVRKGGNEKVWQRVNIEDGSLNTKEFLQELRQSWQDTANKYLDPDHQIDCRSLEAQGITDREPDIHISPTVLAMEKKNPGSTEKMRIHNEIKERNNLPKIIEAIKNIQNELTTIFTRKRKFFHEAYKHHKERLEAFRMAESKTNVETWTPPKTPPETRSTPTPWFAKGQNKKQNKSWEPER